MTSPSTLRFNRVKTPSSKAADSLARAFNISDFTSISKIVSAKILYGGEQSGSESLSREACLKRIEWQVKLALKSDSMLNAELVILDDALCRGGFAHDGVLLTQMFHDGCFGMALCRFKLKDGKLCEIFLSYPSKKLSGIRRSGRLPGISELKEGIAKHMESVSESIIESMPVFKEAILLYSKFSELGGLVLEMEASMRMARESDMFSWMTPGRANFETEELRLLRKLDSGKVDMKEVVELIRLMMKDHLYAGN